MENRVLTAEEVKEIAKLAKLELSDSEIKSYQHRLGRVLGYVEQLEQVAVDAQNGSAAVLPDDLKPFRADDRVAFDSAESLRNLAPEVEGDHYLLPTIVEQG